MKIDEFKNFLENIDHSVQKRHMSATMIMENKNLIPTIFQVAQEIDTPVSCRAMWLLEFVCREELSVIVPHLEAFVKTIQVVYLHSAVRPAAKICESLIVDFYKNKRYYGLSYALTEQYRNQIAACCFDWLIDPKAKVAPKAYGMTTLYYLGTEFDWIHPELKQILTQNYHEGSAAYKARTRMILKKL